MKEKAVPGSMIAQLVRIDNSGEKVLETKELFSYKDAFYMFAEYLINSDEVDDFVKEEYAAFLAGEDYRGMNKYMGWLEKNGELSERCLDAKCDIAIKVFE